MKHMSVDELARTSLASLPSQLLGLHGHESEQSDYIDSGICFASALLICQ